LTLATEPYLKKGAERGFSHGKAEVADKYVFHGCLFFVSYILPPLSNPESSTGGALARRCERDPL
jgi:hypothetical protein